MIQIANGLLTKNRISQNRVGKANSTKFRQFPLKPGVNVLYNVGQMPDQVLKKQGGDKNGGDK